MTPVDPPYSVVGSNKTDASGDPLNTWWASKEDPSDTYTRWDKCQINQGNISVTVDGTDINIAVEDPSAFEVYDSSAGMGNKAWIALGINTGADSIIGINYNGSAFTQADVNEAAEWGLEGGYFILWLDGSRTTGTSFVLSGEGHEDTTVNINIPAAG